MSSLKYWIWLATRQGASPVRTLRVLEQFGSPERAYFADPGEYGLLADIPDKLRAALADKSLAEAERILGECERLGLRVLTLQDAEYPERLRQIPDPPAVLYLRGRTFAFDEEAAIAVVGAREPTPYGVKMAGKLGLELATKTGADLMLATDPDADRVGIAMKCPDGSYELVSGNEMGVLLLDYICAGRIEKGTMPKNPVAVKSIVSTPLADAVAKHYGVEMRNVLTGFKWIGDQIANLEAAGELDRFIFGFEESYGYLAGPYVRDKDAVIGSMLICEMAAYYRSIGSSIKQRLEEIYAQYGRYLNKVDSFEFPGLTGMEKMASIMQKLRDQPPVELAGHKVVKVTDYKKPEETGLPAANVLIYTLENGATVVVRPSGTEPKIKTYFTTLGKTLEEAQAQKDALAAAIEPILK